METETLTKQIEFLKEVEKLKLVLRANKVLGGTRAENSAEHSWHVTLMALVLSKHAEGSIDLQRVLKMLLIHDLVEIDAGDTWLYAADQQTKLTTEHQGATRLFGMLPDAQQREFLHLWQEFEARESADAKYAACIDGIQPLLNHLQTGEPSAGVIPAEKVRAKKAFIQRAAPLLWPLVENLIAASVERGLYSECAAPA